MKKGFYILFSFLAVVVVAFWVSRLPKQEGGCVPQVITVGTSADFPPFSFKKDGELTGFDIEVIKEVAKRLGLTLEFKDMPFELLLPQVQLGTIHVIAAGMTATPERAERVLFTAPYLTSDPLIIISPASQEITSLEDLKEKRVIVNQGYTADNYMSKIPDLNIIRLPSVADAFMALKSGRGDVFVSAASALQPFFEHYGRDAFSIFEIDDVSENLALGISKSYPELAKKIDATLKDMEADGTLQNLKDTWHLT